MYINTRYNSMPIIRFRGNPVPPQDDSSYGLSNNDVIRAVQTGELDPSAIINPKTGDMLLHELVRMNYATAVCFLKAFDKNFSTYVNKPNNNNESPYDLAHTKEMRVVLLRANAKSAKGKTPSLEVVLGLEDDAQVAATKAFMTIPALQRAQENLAKEAAQNEPPAPQDTNASPTEQPESPQAEKPAQDVPDLTESAPQAQNSENSQPSQEISYFDDVIEEVNPKEVEPEENNSDKEEIYPEEHAKLAQEALGMLSAMGLDIHSVPPGQAGPMISIGSDGRPPIGGVNPMSQMPNDQSEQANPINGRVPGNTEGLEFFQQSMLEIFPNDVQNLDDFIGLEDAKTELRHHVVVPLQNEQVSEKLKANDVNLPNGILLLGDGSTITLIKALSSEADLPVIKVESPQDINALNAMLMAAKGRYEKDGSRTGILVQGLDKCFTDEGRSTTSNAFRNKLRDAKKFGVLFIATAQNKSDVPCDFVKSGIIDKVLNVSKPSLNDRVLFLNRYFEGKEVFNDLANEESVARIADLTDNLEYVDILRVLEETARTAAANSQNANMEIFNEELQNFSKETGRVPITDENRTAAYDSEEFQRIPVKPGEMMSLDELAGMPEVKERLRELYVEPMKNIDEMTKIFGADAIPDGAIFFGPPGNGKTLTARVLARELGLPFYETRLSDFGTALVHESSKNFKRFADQLEKKFKETGERSVWFLDEFDGVGGDRNGCGGTDKELVNTLLQEFTNPGERGYILIAATNNPEDVDPALRRRGRLGNLIPFSNPDEGERCDLIRKTLSKYAKTLNNDKFAKEYAQNEEFITWLGKETDGFSMSSIANILKDAVRGFYKSKSDFKTEITKAFEANTKREMAEFCNKAGLHEHVYLDSDFKSLDELGGMSTVIPQLREKVIDLWDPEVRKALKANRSKPSGGFILYGPPGGGKTTVIETMAREMNIPLYKMNYDQEGNQYIHQTSKHIREIFDRLALEVKIRKGRPVILFFDEAERFFPRSADHHHSIEEVNTYKELMNEAAEKGIILAGATNEIWKVNEAIVGNPRRMGTQIECGFPNLEDRKDILTKFTKGLPIIKDKLTDEQITQLAEVTDGYSIGDLRDVLDKIIVKAVRKKEEVGFNVLLEEYSANAESIRTKYEKKENGVGDIVNLLKGNNNNQ